MANESMDERDAVQAQVIEFFDWALSEGLAIEPIVESMARRLKVDKSTVYRWRMQRTKPILALCPMVRKTLRALKKKHQK